MAALAVRRIRLLCGRGGVMCVCVRRSLTGDQRGSQQQQHGAQRRLRAPHGGRVAPPAAALGARSGSLAHGGRSLGAPPHSGSAARGTAAAAGADGALPARRPSTRRSAQAPTRRPRPTWRRGHRQPHALSQGRSTDPVPMDDGRGRGLVSLNGGPCRPLTGSRSVR